MAGPKSVTLEELANRIARTVGVNPPRLKLPKALVWSGVTMMEMGSKVTGIKAPFTRRSMKFYTGNTAFRIEKAERMLDFHPGVELKEGLRSTAEWLQDNSRL